MPIGTEQHGVLDQEQDRFPERHFTTATDRGGIDPTSLEPTQYPSVLPAPQPDATGHPQRLHDPMQIPDTLLGDHEEPHDRDSPHDRSAGPLSQRCVEQHRGNLATTPFAVAHADRDAQHLTGAWPKQTPSQAGETSAATAQSPVSKSSVAGLSHMRGTEDPDDGNSKAAASDEDARSDSTLTMLCFSDPSDEEDFEADEHLSTPSLAQRLFAERRELLNQAQILHTELRDLYRGETVLQEEIRSVMQREVAIQDRFEELNQQMSELNREQRRKRAAESEASGGI